MPRVRRDGGKGEGEERGRKGGKGGEGERGGRTANRFRVVEAPNRLLELLLRLGEEAARERAVGVEAHPQLAQRGEEERVLETGHRAVVALVRGWQDIPSLLAVLVNLAYVLDLVVRQPEPLECAGLVDFVHAGEGVGDGHGGVRGVDVEDVDLSHLQPLK